MTDQPCVLIVEDEPLVLDIAVDEFEDAGYTVLRAESADDATALLNSSSGIDALFTDIRISGGIDGWQLGEIARSIRPGIAVIYATGFTADEPRMVEGAQFFRKPYRMGQIIEATGELIGARG